jgi:hypothetical protein
VFFAAAIAQTKNFTPVEGANLKAKIDNAVTRDGLRDASGLVISSRSGPVWASILKLLVPPERSHSQTMAGR